MSLFIIFLVSIVRSVVTLDQSATLSPSVTSSSGASVQSTSSWVSIDASNTRWSMDAGNGWSKGFDLAISLDSTWAFSTSTISTLSVTINGPNSVGAGDRDLIISINDPVSNNWFSTLIAMDHSNNNAIYPTSGDALASTDINDHITTLFDEICCDLSPSSYEISVPYTITIENDPISETVTVDIDGEQSSQFGTAFEGGNEMEVLISLNAIVDSNIVIESIEFEYQSETEAPTTSPTSIAFGPITFDHTSTFDFNGLSMDIGWLEFSWCEEGNNNAVASSNYHSGFDESELFELLQYAVTVQIGPRNGVPWGAEDNDYTGTADICSNPVFALNNQYELSHVLDTTSDPTVCVIMWCHFFPLNSFSFITIFHDQVTLDNADTSNWIGTTCAVARLQNSCFLSGGIGSPPSDIRDVVYTACGVEQSADCGGGMFPSLSFSLGVD